MEQSTAWAQIKDGTIDSELYDLALPVMKCRSSYSYSGGDNRINYVVNAGPQNLLENDTPRAEEFGRTGRNIRDAAMYTIFFDHIALNGVWNDAPQTTGYGKGCDTKITMDYISRHDGTSVTILLSENEDAGNWIWHAGDINMPRAVHWLPEGLNSANFYPSGFEINIESSVAFCYPSYEFRANKTGGLGLLMSAITPDGATSEIPNYISAVMPPGTDTNTSPLFINEGRAKSGYVGNVYRTTRPSSGHPGGVVAAFCDGNTQFLRDDMDKTLFVRLARPFSRVILNPKEIFD